LGDVAVAIHPDDTRYSRFVGRALKHPFRDGSIPVIADVSVDRSLGTGAVKITPAHDRKDFELARRHSGLSDPITMLDGSGRVTAQFQEFAGLRRFDARRQIRAALASLGLFRGSSSHSMTLPICSRSGDIIEPMLKRQWFVDSGRMSSDAMRVVAEGKLEFVPSFQAKIWNHWLSKPRDWCISRQLWWGHQIPAYRVVKPSPPSSTEEEVWVSASSEVEAREKASLLTGEDISGIDLIRDPDVLDTWFSSAIFPFSAFGWPSRSDDDVSGKGWKDEEGLFPLSVMETGHDILFFWVARMVMLGTQLTDSLPFQRVLLHGMVRDAHGRKMSKSLGNVVDPIDVMTGRDLNSMAQQLDDAGFSPEELQKAKEGQRLSFPEGIPECGSDALRFALLSCDVQAVDVSMDILNIRHHRHFCNKIWQATRFFFHHLNVEGSEFEYLPIEDDGVRYRFSAEDEEILRCYETMIYDCHEGLENFEFRWATSAIHRFIWFELCDVYLEHTKPFLYDLTSGERNLKLSVILFCLEGSMRTLHPFMPFLTEELWQRLSVLITGPERIESICLSRYPVKGEKPTLTNEE